MAIEINNNLPLMLDLAILPKEYALQRESFPKAPSEYRQDLVIIDDGIEVESDTFWEKGTFIDIYI